MVLHQVTVTTLGTDEEMRVMVRSNGRDRVKDRRSSYGTVMSSLS